MAAGGPRPAGQARRAGDKPVAQASDRLVERIAIDPRQVTASFSAWTRAWRSAARTFQVCLLYNAMLHLDRDEPELALHRLDAAEALAAEQRLGFAVYPQILHGAVLSAQGALNEGVTCLRDGLVRPGAARLRPYGFLRLAEALAGGGEYPAARYEQHRHDDPHRLPLFYRREKLFQAGADDYVVKLLSITELLARIRALLRRTRGHPESRCLQFREIVMDLAAFRVTRNGRNVHLGPTEFQLLRFLMQHPNRTSREEIIHEIWGADAAVDPRTVDVYVWRLRDAITNEGEPEVIRTVRTAGYALNIE